MTNYKSGKMSGFPIAMNGADRFDVVFMGKVVPNYVNSDIPNLLYNDYVFLFATKLNLREDSAWYGDVKIHLVRHDQLSYFNYPLKEQGSFHVLENESLILNDYLEVVPEETENGIHIFAHLKKQNIIGEDHRTVEKVRDFHVLLLRENKDERYDNYPILELGPEFQAQIDLDRAEQRYFNLSDCSSMLQGIGYRNQGSPEVISAIEVTQKALNKELNDAELIKKHAFERYSNYNRRLSYFHKRTHFY